MVKKKEKERLEEKIRQENIEKGNRVELFSGSLEEFEKLKGSQYQIIDTGKQEK